MISANGFDPIGISASAPFEMGADELSQLGKSLAVKFMTLRSGACALPERSGGPRSVCVSGARGFLGAHVIAECLSRGAVVHAMCRRPDKLSAALKGFGLDPELAHRVTLFDGELSQMREQDFPDADAFIHCAGRIHALAPLQKLWRDNAACAASAMSVYAARDSRVVFASTLSCFVSSNVAGSHAEEPLAASADILLRGGYAQSKLVAESAALELGACCARLGLLTGSTINGIFPSGSFFEAFAQGVARMGTVPEGFEEAWVDATPVDAAARALAELALEEDEPERIVHVANPRALALSMLIAPLAPRPIPKGQYEDALRGSPRLFQALAKAAFDKAAAMAERPERFNLDLFQATGHDFNSRLPIAIPNEALAELYLARFGLISRRHHHG